MQKYEKKKYQQAKKKNFFLLSMFLNKAIKNTSLFSLFINNLLYLPPN